MERQDALRPSRTGVLLLDSQLSPVHFNAEAAAILGYPNSLEQIPSLDAVLPAAPGQIPSPLGPTLPDGFTSGRRRYVCRAFLVDHANSADRRLAPKYVVILERARESQVDVSRWSQQYQLTSRERETVAYLLKGLTSKEIAIKMNISPSTVKSFLKLIMVKVGASNRAGIVAMVHDPPLPRFAPVTDRRVGKR
jgi:DNA-binding CsgD family transcriptional regulator